MEIWHQLHEIHVGAQVSGLWSAVSSHRTPKRLSWIPACRSCSSTIAAVVLILLVGPTSAGAPVRVVYQGRSVSTTAPVVRHSPGTLVPLRATMEALGGSARWDSRTRSAWATHGDRRLQVNPGSQTMALDYRTLTAYPLPRVEEGQLLVPMQAIERLCGVRGRWLPAQRLLRFTAAPGRGGGGGATVMDHGQPAGGGQLRLTTDRPAYPAGATVALTLTVTNAGSAPVTMQFSSGQKYDFEVRRAGQVVWRWAADRMFTQALTNLTLAPGERKVFTETWKQQDNQGQVVPAGTYEVTATLTTMERPQPRTAPLTMRIGG
jgi:hypothetical protein